ncbi:MAG: hypothetical protein ACKO7V_10135, partial [Bacteroidota bacterium]
AAAKANPALQEDCNALINKYSGYFPSKQTLFFNKPAYKLGDGYRVGCWLNESTTVRSSD